MNSFERDLRIKLSLLEGFGPRYFRQVIENFGDISAFVEVYRSGDYGDMNKEFVKRIGSWCDDFDIKEFCGDLEYRGISTIVYGEIYYPPLLSQMYDPPIVLYAKGNKEVLLNENTLAVVGTRACSQYGVAVTKKIVSEVAPGGPVVVSGLAYGIDRVAHEVALKENLKTIAVLASSVDDPTPRGNNHLYQSILSNNGIVISQYPPFAGVVPGHFPARNRIIAGVSKSVLVTEAPQKSGALITADIAFRENRSVYAIPGNILGSKSEGTNNLIRIEKARLVSNGKDILDDWGFHLSKSAMKPTMIKGKEQNCVYELLKSGAKSIDTLAAKVDMSYQDLLASLSVMEIDGLITKDDEDRFCVII